DGIVPIRQSNLQFSGTAAEQQSCRFTPPQLLRPEIDLPQRILGSVGNAAHPFLAGTQGVSCLLLGGNVALCSPCADQLSVLLNADQVAQEIFRIAMYVH